jgi:hypothetical protein
MEFSISALPPPAELQAASAVASATMAPMRNGRRGRP